MTRCRIYSAVGALAIGLLVGGTANAGADYPHALATPAHAASDAAPVVFLTAELTGGNEIPVPNGPRVGDRNGRAVEALRITGNQLSYAIAWQNITPTEAHIHSGGIRANGPVVVPFFTALGGLPATVHAVLGTVTVADPALLSRLVADPGAFYVNLHTAAFPGGAVRGQLHTARHPVDANQLLDVGSLVSVNSGEQEVPAAGAVVGDPAAHATGFIGLAGDEVRYAFAWSGFSAPIAAHIHAGAVGVDGAVVVPLFSAPGGLPGSITAVAGAVPRVSRQVISRIASDPRGYYTNLHTAAFPGGATRGQLFVPGSPVQPPLPQW